METENRQPNVSVVMPLFNPNKVFFKQAVESILQQKWLPNEVVLSDDSDQTEESISALITQWKQKGINIIYIKNQRRRGIFSNLNHAISQTSGEFIQILCQDDIMKEDLLKRHVEILEDHPEVGIIFSQFDVITEHGDVHKLEPRYNYRKDIPDYIPHADMMLYFLKLGCLPGNLSPVMIRRKVIQEIGWFDPSYTFAGDFEYWVRAATKFDFYFCKEVLLQVRRHDQQASKALSDIELIRERGLIYAFLLEHQVQMKSKWRMRLYLNRVIGSQHVHKMMKGLLFGNISKEELSSYVQFLNQGPFRFTTSLFLYFITANNRLTGIMPSTS